MKVQVRISEDLEDRMSGYIGLVYLRTGQHLSMARVAMVAIKQFEAAGLECSKTGIKGFATSDGTNISVSCKYTAHEIRYMINWFLLRNPVPKPNKKDQEKIKKQLLIETESAHYFNSKVRQKAYLIKGQAL